MAFNIEKNKDFRKILVQVGVSILILSLLLFSACLLGLAKFETFSFFGHSGLRSIAAISVIGCMIAAIGYWDD